MADNLDKFLHGLVRYAEFLPPDEDHPLEVLVLKWHLLIEEELRELVRAKFVDKKAFDLSHCKFSNLLRLARALYGDILRPWEWEVAHQLNTVRNSLAHTLRDETLEPRIKERIFAVFQREDNTFSYTEKAVVGKLGYCLSYIHTALLRVRVG